MVGLAAAACGGSGDDTSGAAAATTTTTAASGTTAAASQACADAAALKASMAELDEIDPGRHLLGRSTSPGPSMFHPCGMTRDPDQVGSIEPLVSGFGEDGRPARGRYGGHLVTGPRFEDRRDFEDADRGFVAKLDRPRLVPDLLPLAPEHALVVWKATARS